MDPAVYRTLAFITFALACPCLAQPALAQGREAPLRVVVPSRDFPTIQGGIDAVGDGGTVIIRAGVYEETLTLSGKRVKLVGNGARGPERTEFVGPLPSEIVSAEQARGLITYGPGAGGELSALALRGGDAGILGQARDGRFPAALEVTDVLIQEGARGILGSFSDLTVRSTEVSSTSYNGISLVEASGAVEFTDLLVQWSAATGVLIFNSGQAGAPIKIQDSMFNDNPQGGIVIYGGAKAIEIRDCVLIGNSYAGIRLKGASTALIEDASILHTHERLSDGKYGDGVLLECCQDVVVRQSDGNTLGWIAGIYYSARVGLSSFGSHVSIQNLILECNTFDLAGEYMPAGECGSAEESFSILDLGNNVCGCPKGTEACQALSMNLQPPEAKDPSP